MSTNKAASRTSIRKVISNGLNQIPTYCDGIPMDEILQAARAAGALVVDESGDEWEGIFCGAEGNSNFEVIHPLLKKPFYIFLSWYKMPSSRYEIVVYVS